MPAHMPCRNSQPGLSRETPVTRYSPPISCGARHRAWRIGEMPVLAASVMMTALLAGCASSATTGPSAPATQSQHRPRRKSRTPYLRSKIPAWPPHGFARQAEACAQATHSFRQIRAFRL
jgi:hypothetical protein